MSNPWNARCDQLGQTILDLRAAYYHNLQTGFVSVARSTHNEATGNKVKSVFDSQSQSIIYMIASDRIWLCKNHVEERTPEREA